MRARAGLQGIRGLRCASRTKTDDMQASKAPRKGHRLGYPRVKCASPGFVRLDVPNTLAATPCACLMLGDRAWSWRYAPQGIVIARTFSPPKRSGLVRFGTCYWQVPTYKRGYPTEYDDTLIHKLTFLRRRSPDLQVWGGSAAYLAFTGIHSRSRQDVAPRDNTWR